MFNVKFNEAIDAAKFAQEQLRNEFEKRDPQEFYLTFDDFEKIMTLLVKSIDAGGGMREFCKSLLYNGIKLPDYADETFYRTTMHGFFMAGSWMQFESNDRPYLMYDCIGDSRSKRGHKSANGIIRHVHDEIWDVIYPPNSINCRCAIISLTEEQAISRSKNRQGLKKPLPKTTVTNDGFDFNVGKNITKFIHVGFFDIAKNGLKYKRD